jgi:hypothetical protein
MATRFRRDGIGHQRPSVACAEESCRLSASLEADDGKLGDWTLNYYYIIIEKKTMMDSKDVGVRTKSPGMRIASPGCHSTANAPGLVWMLLTSTDAPAQATRFILLLNVWQQITSNADY